MGRVNPHPGRGFACRLVLLKLDPDGEGSIASTAYDGDVEVIAPGIRAFRREGGRVFVVQRIAKAGARMLAVVYTPGAARDAQAPFAALVADLGVDVVKSWAVNLNADGTLRIPTLVSDGTAIGTAVKAAWPATWRVLLGTDPPEGPPTGPLFIASVLA